MSMQTSRGATPGQPAPDGVAAKRRKIRKGTFSCWECKRRKKRCELQSTSDSACLSCQRLGAQCVSQDVDEPIEQGDQETEKRLADIEALVAGLERQKKYHHPLEQSRARLKEWPGQPWKNGFLQVSAIEPAARLRQGSSGLTRLTGLCTPLQATIATSVSSRLSVMKAFMISVLPAPETASAIISQGQSPLAVLETSASVSRVFGTEGQDHQASHPLELAQGLIHLALCLERLDLNQSEAMEARLEAPRSLVARQYVDAAHHVTCQDSIMDSFDSLEILMLESSFEMSTGNVRSAWLNVRRALNIAQLIIPRGKTKQMAKREALIHLRLVLFDRVLSLMLGCSHESSIVEYWMSKHITSTSLEHKHAEISGWIIVRNLQMQERLNRDGEMSDGYDDYQQTRNIDKELKEAMRTFRPLHHADIPTVKSDMAAHYVDQMHHYDLLVLTHLPYLLKGPHLEEPSTNRIECDYSRSVGLLAAREVLSRVLICCKSPRIPNLSGGLSHKTYISVIVLLLSHISGHALGYENSQEHQRSSDLSIVIEIMDEMSRLSEAKRGIFNTRVITELIAVEQHAADGHLYDARTIKASQKAVQLLEQPSNTRLQFDLAYLGTVLIQPRLVQATLTRDLQENAEDASTELCLFDPPWNPQNSLFDDCGNDTWPLEAGMINGTEYLDG